MKYTGEIFSIPLDDDQHLLYAPLSQASAIVNDRAVQLVDQFVSGIALDEINLPWIDQLSEAGFLSGKEPEKMDVNEAYRPTDVTLFSSNKCNLSCVYCYASATHVGEELQWEIARAAIDLVFKNARVKEVDVGIGFHGAGEPTMGWSMIERSLEHAQRCSQTYGIHFQSAIATNGCLSEKNAQYLGDHFDQTTLSWDGIFQDQQRPLRNGQPSSPLFERTCKILNESPTTVDFRITITSESLGTLKELPLLVKKLCPTVQHIHIEPVWSSGRGSSGMMPDSDLFVEQFLLARKQAEHLDLKLIYSGLRNEVLVRSFCAMNQPAFTVVPGGYVTACFEVVKKDDSRSSITHFGAYNPSNQAFEFDLERIRKLRSYDVDQIEFCRDCFCRWHCAGDCFVKVLKGLDPKTHAGSSRCQITRELTKRTLCENLGYEANQGAMMTIS